MSSKVALIYNSSTAADKIASGIASENNVIARAYQANVANRESIDAAVQQIVKDFRKLDIMVVNSGIASCVAAEEYTPEQWKQVMDVNLDGAFYSAQAAAKIFKAQGSGNVIFTASVSATLVNVPQKQAAVRLILTASHFVFTGVVWASANLNIYSTMLQKRVSFNWQSACPLNGLTSVESTVSPQALLPLKSWTSTRKSGGRSG